jgi:hypothetical protein
MTTHPPDLDSLSRALAALGAETSTQRSVKRIVPWIISAAVHTGIIMLALAITYTVRHLPAKDESVLIVADFNALNYAPVVGSNDARTEVAGPMVKDLATPLPTGEQVTDRLRASEGLPNIDVSAALGHSGISDGGVAALSQFAPKAGPISATFAGVTGSNARKIVYAIDASGSMISSFQIVIDELSRSLANLSPQQSFAVIFFQETRAIETPPAGRFVPATAEERSRVLKWINANVVPAGGTNPLVAIEKALAIKPDVVFLLSQDITGYGQFEVDQQDLLSLLDKLNPRDSETGRRKTQINCIQFLDADPLDTMPAIAREHGGPNGYKFLSRKELGLGSP